MSKKLTPKVEQEMSDLAEEFFTKNSAMNKNKREADAAKKKLMGLLEDHGIKEFNSEHTNEDGSVYRLVSAITKKTRDVIDVKKLSKLVKPKQFWQVISATKKAVTDVCGTLTADQVAKSVPMNPSLSVKKG